VSSVGPYSKELRVSVMSLIKVDLSSLEVHLLYYVCCRSFSLSKSHILHELIELSRDEESSVRVASLETLVDLLDFFEKSKLIVLRWWLGVTIGTYILL